jgi:hypothetical protein
MLRVAPLLLSVSIATQSVALAEDAKQDTIEVHGKTLPLSCAEWKHNQDGSWTSIGSLLVGTEVVNEVTLRGGKQTKTLSEKCGNPSSPSAAAPAASAKDCSQERHTRHGCRIKEPAAGG